MTDSIARLRKLSIKVDDPRVLEEWTVPVHPADLRYILTRYDALVKENNSRRKLLNSDYDMSDSELGNHDI